ncbi:MAG: hypothetical protein ACK4ZJ_07705, partial [Allorhizobium sp.]
AKRFSKGIDRLGHNRDLEQNKNIVKCANDHKTLLPLVFKAFQGDLRRAGATFCAAARSLKINHKFCGL